MGSKNIWLTALLIVIAGGAAIGGVYLSRIISAQNAQIQSLQNQIASLQDRLKNKPSQPPQAISYTNDKYGFGLTFPAAWAGYKVSNREVKWGPIGSADSYDFGFGAQDSIFNIGIVSHAQWSAIQAQGGPIPTFLGSDADHVFVYEMSQYAANDAMAARRDEVAGIVSTFKLR